MPVDPKTQPLVALAKKWRDRAVEIQERLDCHESALWARQKGLSRDTLARLLAERTECLEHAKQLETALEAQRQHLLAEAEMNCFVDTFHSGMAEAFRIAAELLKVER